MNLVSRQTRRRAAERARDHFTRAAAALTEPVTPGVVAFALLESSMGLLALAEADDEDRSGEARAVACLRAHIDSRP